jgi:outer membrane receptor for ferrienterochelin and colicins
VRNFLNISNHTNYIGAKALDMNTTLNGSFVTSDSKIGVFLFGVHRNREAYDRDNDGFSEIPTLNSSTVGFRSYFKTSDYSKITAEYHHLGEFRRGGNNLDRPPHEADIAEQLRHNIDAGSVKFDYFTPDNKHFLSTYASSQI